MAEIIEGQKESSQSLRSFMKSLSPLTSALLCDYLLKAPPPLLSTTTLGLRFQDRLRPGSCILGTVSTSRHLLVLSISFVHFWHFHQILRFPTSLQILYVFMHAILFLNSRINFINHRYSKFLIGYFKYLSFLK